jgi:hypothetical protein
MSDGQRITRVLLAWSKADLEAADDSEVIVCLTPTTSLLARKSHKGKAADPDKYLRRDWQGIFPTATDLLNSLHAEFSCSTVPAWMEGSINIVFFELFAQVLTWLSLFRNLGASFSEQEVVLMPPAAFLNPSLREHPYEDVAVHAFWVAARVVMRDGIRFRAHNGGEVPSSSRSFRAMAERAGARLAARFRFSEWGMMVSRSYRASERRRHLRRADVLLVTNQATDAAHGTPLAKALAVSLGEGFLWISSRSVSTALTPEEIALADGPCKGIRRLDVEELIPSDLTGYRAAKLVRLAAQWKLVERLSGREGNQLGRRDWEALLEHPMLEDLATKCQAWASILEAIQPRVIIGLSTLQDMALIRAWARRQGVPFVQFMHGAVPLLNHFYNSDGDYVGVFGPHWVTQIKAHAPNRTQKVEVCGAMQFGTKMRAASQFWAPPESKENGYVLFIANGDWLPFYPLPLALQARAVRELFTACRDIDRPLRMRTHPRLPRGQFWGPYAEELALQNPQAISVSTEPSTFKDISGADFLVAAGFDGATLEALMLEKIVLFYVPDDIRFKEGPFDFDKIGGLVKTEEELRSAFACLMKGSGFRDQLRAKQQAFLREYIVDENKDPWDGARCFVESIVKGLSQRKDFAAPRQAG